LSSQLKLDTKSATTLQHLTAPCRGMYLDLSVFFRSLFMKLSTNFYLEIPKPSHLLVCLKIL